MGVRRYFSGLRALFVLAGLVCLASGLRPALAAEAPLRFLVVADPQFRALGTDPAERRYRWTGDGMWPRLPEVMRKVGARYLFVCGDIFEYYEGDPAGVPELWDVWDRYVKTFAGIGRIEWVPGGHEFWGRDAGAARTLFLRRYPGHVRYTVTEGDSRFVLLDNLHDPMYFDREGLRWLEDALKPDPGVKHTWFFGHVPPRNTADWWPGPGKQANDAFRGRMAGLLERGKVSAAFFGHEHMEAYLGDPGGFPMFVAACRYPLLVEVAPQGISYRWLLAPASDDPLRATVDALSARPVPQWQVAVVPRGAELPSLPGAADATEAGPSGLRFRPLEAPEGVADLGALAGLQEGDRVVATAAYRLGRGFHNRHALLRSDLPFSIWINGTHYETSPGTGGRLHGYMMNKAEANRVVLLLEARGPERRFSFIRQTFPPDLAEDARVKGQ